MPMHVGRWQPVSATALHKGGDGEPMVLLHGFGNTWGAWTPILPALEARHAVFAPTAPGHHGGPPFADGEPPSAAAMVEFVEGQMDAEGIDRAHLVGNSMGAWLSLELALRGRALSVVGLNPAGGFERDSREAHAVVRFIRRNMILLRIVRPWLGMIARRAPLRVIAYRDLVAHPSRVDASLALAGLEGARILSSAPDTRASMAMNCSRVAGSQCSASSARPSRERWGGGVDDDPLSVHNGDQVPMDVYDPGVRNRGCDLWPNCSLPDSDPVDRRGARSAAGPRGRARRGLRPGRDALWSRCRASRAAFPRRCDRSAGHRERLWREGMVDWQSSARSQAS